MKISKRELFEQLDKYPEDYEVELGHYFLVNVSAQDEDERYYQAMYKMDILGTAADEKSKVIRFVLDSSHKEVIERISGGMVPIEDPHVTRIAARKAANEGEEAKPSKQKRKAASQ